MNINSKLVGAGLAAMGAVSLCAISDPAAASSISQPGEIAGYTWAPLPEGLYFATTESYGDSRNLAAYNSELGQSIPVIVWSTPWTLFGGRVESYVAVPSISAVNPHPVNAAGFPQPGTHAAGFLAPFGAVGLAWDLGNGWGVSEFVGGYGPSNNSFGVDFWTFNERFGVTWAQNGWSLTGHVIYGVTGNYLGSGPAYGTKTSPDYINLDLTGTYTYGKWTLGAVGYGSWDVSGISNAPNYAKQGMFAVGPFVGYNFGPVILQTYIARDIYSHNYVNPLGDKIYETRGWLRVIVPLWNPPAPAPVVAKY